MGYDPEIYAAVSAAFTARREASKNTAARRRAEIDAKIPEIARLEEEMRQTAISVTKELIASRDSALLQGLTLRGQQLSARKAELLRQNGYPSDYLRERPICEKCGDTGYIQGRMCECMREALRGEAARRLDAVTGTGRVRFEDVSLDYYPSARDPNTGVSPRKLMENALEYCRAYAEGFRLGADNLCFTGGSGLGKTWLSVAVAYAISDRGFGVMYGSVADLTGAVEREHFERGNQRGYLDRLLTADFLVLDDLGAEFSTSFSVATLYNIVNTRMLRGLPTLISSNLAPKEMTDRYGERFTSRLTGCYRIYGFLGTDIRVQKRMRRP